MLCEERETEMAGELIGIAEFMSGSAGWAYGGAIGSLFEICVGVEEDKAVEPHRKRQKLVTELKETAVGKAPVELSS
jgi:hypothetical protein